MEQPRPKIQWHDVKQLLKRVLLIETFCMEWTTSNGWQLLFSLNNIPTIKFPFGLYFRLCLLHSPLILIAQITMLSNQMSDSRKSH